MTGRTPAREGWRAHAVVVGTGLAGLLAAASLAKRFDVVTVLDRDELPQQPGARSGVPQGVHPHVLWSEGARAIERLLSGFERAVIEAGARRINLPDELLMYSGFGWLPRFTEQQFIIASSQPLLESVVRKRLLADPRVTIIDSTEVVGLLGDASQVTGVRLAGRAASDSAELSADVVIDATGRGSRMTNWLADLGVPPAREERIDAGWAYATRTFRARSEQSPVVTVAPDQRPGVPARAGLLLPIENGQWLVTLSASRGVDMPSDPAEFLAYARALRDPVIGDLIAVAEPLTPIQSSRSTVNRRFRYGRVRRWPAGLVVLGDAAAAFNPYYGQGIGVAALSAEAIGKIFQYCGAERRTFMLAQRAVERVAGAAWSVAVGQDLSYPGVIGGRPRPVDRMVLRYR